MPIILRLGVSENNRFKFAVRFFNYRVQTHEIMDLGGCTGNLRSIPLGYLQNLDEKKKGREPFRHKPEGHPVILVLDNDDGLKSIANTLKTVFGVLITTTSTDDLYHITENLHLIKTTETNGSSCIEDLFPA